MGVKIQTTRVACDTDAGSQDITIDGFGTPKAALFMISCATTDDTATTHAYFGIGATDGTTQWACSIATEDGLGTTDTNSRAMTDECVALLHDAGNIDGEGNSTTLITDGVRVTWGDAPSAARLMTVVLFGGNDLTAKVGNTQDLGASTDTQFSVTGVGFEPDALIMASHGQDFDDVAKAQATISVGFAANDGSETQRALGWVDTDNQGTTSINAQLDTSKILSLVFAGAQNKEIELDSFEADGFKITTGSTAWYSNPGYLALNFNGAAKAAVGSLDTPTSDGSVSYTWPGFRPSFLLHLCSYLAAEDSVSATGNAEAFGVGVVDGTNEYVINVHSDDGLGTSRAQSMSSSRMAQSLMATGGTLQNKWAFTSFNATGYTISSTLTNGTARKFAGLAIETTRNRSFGIGGMGGGFFFGPGS